MVTPGKPRADLGAIRLLLTDVDGVLTDGRVHFSAEGQELKTFHVHDGAGLVYWHRCGGLSGFVSGRGGEIVAARARDLGVHEVVLLCKDKLAAVEEILRRRALPPESVAYVGDDLVDLTVMRHVGFAVSVPNGRDEVRAAAHYVTATRGGEGALREVVELLLRARGQWDSVVGRGGAP